MYDQVTLKLNVDPYILSALKEDITSEDVSTNSVMPHPQQGEVDLICKEDGVICGLQVFERVFTLLDEQTKVEFFVDILLILINHWIFIIKIFQRKNIK